MSRKINRLINVCKKIKKEYISRDSSPDLYNIYRGHYSILHLRYIYSIIEINVELCSICMYNSKKCRWFVIGE